MIAIKMGSLFDGSGGFALAAILSGITPVWSSEIEPFPIRVTTKRIPQMKHYGDINKLSGYALDSVDIITGGSPCQDMSVAGKRAGLKHHDKGDEQNTRSGLFMEQVRIIKEMRENTDGKYPRFMVWENVLGAFSSNKGEDFRAVLEETAKIADKTAIIPKPEKGKWANCGAIMGRGWSIAWRTFDAQFWGVPQRRRRIYLVADFNGERAPEILFKRDGMRRDYSQSFRTWQKAPEHSANSTRAANTPPDELIPYFILENHPADSRVKLIEDGKFQTLTSRMGTGGGNIPLVLDQLPKTYVICAKESNAMESANPYSGFYETSTSRCLDANGGNPTCNQGGVAIVASEKADKPNEVIYAIDRATFNCGNSYAKKMGITTDGINSTLTAKGPGAVAMPTFDLKYIVRRLTPTECARLQGFPDWWCDNLGEPEPAKEDIQKWQAIFREHSIITKGKDVEKSEKQIKKWLQNPHSDSAEYKMWGNGIALPNALYVMEGIADILSQEE